ncbi:fatty acid/phospholipid synthesis protein PlsX [Peptoniphilus duerdenii ATCC BAA-1640]|uniref:Phosphate acyltransferase n=1 Tax=Peptoniphilus duerdenii ATCC BAA-1640 TaxID=862517 RepID=E0NMQ9_9FIRM|nr:phosphate acyltransferase PlsX [Peptoniphilus duerdenii]EFM24877.1 fatty acid/phospholipid synthesis protein PlsX [Peptoniphilus duerdenii ATCC BAA-1640]
MKILFDTTGLDLGVKEVIEGAILSKEELNIEPTLVGDEDIIRPILNEIGMDMNILDAKEIITNEEEPAFAIRRKKDSSIVVAFNNLNEYDAFISCGSTGALLAGGMFMAGRINNVKRAVLPTPIPTINGNTLLIDSGANMDVDADLLVQFAKLGTVLKQVTEGIEKPKVGLLNVGVEENKGNALTKEAFLKLKEADINFIGNIEGRDINKHLCDVLVCDGFVGNIILKNTEGLAGFIMTLLKSKVISNLSDNAKLEVMQSLSPVVKTLDYREVGGVLLLGLKKLVIKAHGASDRNAIKNAAKSALLMHENKLIDKIENSFRGEI